MTNDEATQWRRLTRLAKMFSWITLAGVVYGLLVAHLPPLLGYPWSGPRSIARALTFHLFEVPIVLYQTLVAYVGLFRLSRATARRYYSLVGLYVVVSLVFMLFEIVLIVLSLQRGSPAYEIWLVASIAILLLVGAGLGFLIQLAFDAYFHPIEDPRFEHPTDERALIALVRKARRLGVQVRVRGSEHSVNAAIYTDAGEQHINIQLDRYTAILDWDKEKKQVTVQAGCHLGVDPGDPLSTKENSLTYQLDQRGWALPDLGGITHQTVGGFISTGSAGGTARIDLGKAIVGIRLIDGNGQVHDLAPNPNDPQDEQTNPFYAAGVSMGLLGIISTVTFQCEDSFQIIGRNTTSSLSACRIDLFDDGENGLRRYLERTQFTRLLWWPQKNVEKMQVWEARRTDAADAKKTHRPPSISGEFVRRPYIAVPLGRVSQIVIHLFYRFMSRRKAPYGGFTTMFAERVLNFFVRNGSVEFWDSWHEGLPMDNQISSRLIPTEFTELWISLERSAELMCDLRDFYAGDQGMQRTGTLCCEVYAAPESRFWLSPNYGRTMIRVNFFCFQSEGDNSAKDFFPQYWRLLKRYDYRFHPGKHMSAADSGAQTERLRRQYPMWNQFMEVREKMDPEQIFVTTYWRERLAIVS